MTTKIGQWKQKGCGQKCWGRTAVTEKPWQDSWYRTDREESRDTGWYRQDKKRGQSSQNMIEGQGSCDRITVMR
jgi:hypothetical protein